MKRQKTDDSRASQEELSRQLKSGQIGPLYLFEGAEGYLRQEALKRLIEAAVDAAVRDFNVSRFSVAGGRLSEALTIAGQLPMVAQRRVVVIVDFEALNDERELERLKEYLRRPVESTVLIFESAGLDNRRAIATMLRKTCQSVTFEPLDDREGAPRWVVDYVSRAGAYLEPGAAAYLVGMVGNDLQRLSNEAEKLISYTGGRGRITRTEIEAVVRYSREHSNFELTDAIIDGDRPRALKLLNHIFANPPEPPQTLAIMILGAVGANYRKMLTAKELMRQNAPNEEVAKAVGMSPYGVTRFNERVRRLETEAITRGLARIAMADVALKSSLATPRLQLEMLICELCPSEIADRRDPRPRR